MSRIVTAVAACLLLSGCCCPIGSWLQHERESTYNPPPPTVSITPPSFPTPVVPPMPNVPGVNPGTTAPVDPGGRPAAGRPPPASFGVTECDEYARTACGCPNAAVRDNLCDAAHNSFDGWRTTATGPARPVIVDSCTRLTGTMRQMCPAAADEQIPSIGIPNCDAYAQRACTCSNTMARASMCGAARSSLRTFESVMRIGSMTRDRINTSCQNLLDSANRACP